MNWKDLAKKAASIGLPTIGTALAGGAGAKVGSMIASAIGCDPTPEAVDAALTPENQVALFKLESDERVQMASLASAERTTEMLEDTKRTVAVLSDVANARARDTDIIHTVGHNYRADVMLAMTFIGLFVCIGLMLHFKVDANTAIGGVLILIAGKFIGNWGTAFDYEFGAAQQDKTGDKSSLIRVLKDKLGQT